MRRIFVLAFGILFLAALVPAEAQTCVECHGELTPGIVSDWEISAHGRNEVDCSVCHGEDHTSADDVAEVSLPTPEVCAHCHEKQVEQFSRGKHALAWAAMEAMPTFHWQPMALTEGMKGCGGCHKIGLKDEAAMIDLKQNGDGYGVASCDSCHTRHLFSAEEARQPQACRTCHMGFDHPQWEMYSSSKHGVRHSMKQLAYVEQDASAPSCQDCHMSGGDHEVRTAWGFLAVRMPLPEEEDWAADQVTILKALGVLDPEGKPTARLDAVRAADVARLDEASWKRERDKMIGICSKCHSRKYAESQLARGDEMIRAGDRLMAEAIRIVAGLYESKILPVPESYAYAFPDLLTFHDAPTSVEQRLFVMFLKHRMRLFQGTFHANPDYALWYGWSEMQRDLTEIREMAGELRERAATEK